MSDFIYQYTDINAVQSIVKSNRVRATHFKFLNDYSEVLHGIDLILEKVIFDKKLNNELKESIKIDVYSAVDKYDIYVASFTNAGDRLSMWRGYGGYALQFNKSLITLGITIEGTFRSNSVLPCFYTNDFNEINLLHSYPEIIYNYDKFYCNGRKDWFSLSVISSAVSIKNKGFYEEEEHRALIVLGSEDKAVIHHRVSNNISIPFVELILPESSVTGVVIGPNQDKDRAVIGLNSYLKANELEHIKLYGSEITFRIQ
ncbi:DUF2971 domain-containing protein [Alteromonas stellipolaris]|uniref:DUF2971 domain-containing protein n=1 Tax=Alteromonas stellipolaris TaxID=233316 RepID=UPI0021184838|nr:DUF2971 domain-containing protein [Alteromonas stellipolaris]MCQ8848978.1 DUF2971 domain-containing protein [Alteromonas stellipolaris]